MSRLLEGASHPSEHVLARYAGGDATWPERWYVSRHVRQCEECEELVVRYQMDRAMLQDNAAEPPHALDWASLEREMRGNILVGLAASEAIQPEPAPRDRLGWRAGLAAAALTAVVMGGWFFRDPRELVANMQKAWNPQQASVSVSAEPDGVAVTEGKSQLMLLRPKSASEPMMTTRGPRVVQTSYVDEDSGQVTITHVSME